MAMLRLLLYRCSTQIRTSQKPKRRPKVQILHNLETFFEQQHPNMRFFEVFTGLKFAAEPYCKIQSFYEVCT